MALEKEAEEAGEEMERTHGPTFAILMRVGAAHCARVLTCFASASPQR